MTFKTMRYVLAVAEQGSFSGAARQLYLSQPSLSQSVLAVERELGVALFDRSSNPLSLTPAGERFVATARRILLLESGLLAELGVLGEQAQPLRVAASAFRLQSLLVGAYRRFSHLHPSVVLRMYEAENDKLVHMALSAQADLVMVEGQPPDALSAHRVQREELLLAVPRDHPAAQNYPARAGVPLEDFAEDLFVLPAAPLYLRSLCEELFHEQRFAPRPLVETRSIELALHCVRQGLAVAPVYATHAAAMGEGVALLTPGRGGKRFGVYLCHRQETEPPPAMLEFIRLVREQAEFVAGRAGATAGS